MLQAEEKFTYLDSTLSSDCRIDAEVNNRIAKTSGDLELLTQDCGMWRNTLRHKGSNIKRGPKKQVINFKHF